MSRKVGLRARFRYWFDNTMSRGVGGLIVWLAVFSVAIVIVVTAAIELVYPTNDRPPAPLLLWQTFISTFSLSAPDDGPPQVLAFWFVLALAGIFVVSALVGLLTSGLHRRLEQLRKGR